MRVEQFLSESAQRRGLEPAIVAAGRSHSYRELGRSAERVAAALVAHGIGRGDRVMVLMDDNFAAVVTAFAVLIAGAVVCAIDPRAKIEEFRGALDASGAVALATEARFASAAGAALATAAAVRLVLLSGGDRSTASASCLCFEDLIAGIGPAPAMPRAGSASDAAMLLPGAGDGSAGPLVLSHAELVAVATATVHEAAAPRLRSIFTAYGLCQLLAAVKAGATIVLESSSVLRQSVFSREDDGAEPAPILAG